MSSHDELARRIVAWSTNYTEMDCNRVRDAKPLMDDLLRHVEELERERDEARRERDAWIETSASAYSDSDFYQGIVRHIGNHFGVAAYTSDDGSVQQNILALKVLELVEQLVYESEAGGPSMSSETHADDLRGRSAIQDLIADAIDRVANMNVDVQPPHVILQMLANEIRQLPMPAVADSERIEELELELLERSIVATEAPHDE